MSSSTVAWHRSPLRFPEHGFSALASASPIRVKIAEGRSTVPRKPDGMARPLGKRMADVLDDLIAAVYGSLTGPEGHAAFVRMFASAFRSHIVACQIDRPGHAHAALAHYDAQGNPADDLAISASRQPYTNPWFESPMVAALFHDGAVHDEGYLAPQKLRTTEFHADVLKPFDIFHSMGLVLEHGQQTSVITISRSHRAGYYDNDELTLAKRLLPHLRTIHAIQQAIAEQCIADATCTEPAWALTEDGRVCGMNKTAQCSHMRSLSLEVRDGHLQPENAQDRADWRTAMNDVLTGCRSHRRVALRNAEGVPNSVLHLTPCRREAFLSWLLSESPAMLAILKPIHPDPSELLVELPRLYGLTPAECRVAVKLLELDSLTCIADSLCRSEQTVRSQLKAIYAKTNTHSQMQLLKLLLGLSGD